MSEQKRPTRNQNLQPAWITKPTFERLGRYKAKTHASKGRTADDAINFYLDILEAGKRPEEIWQK